MSDSLFDEELENDEFVAASDDDVGMTSDESPLDDTDDDSTDSDSETIKSKFTVFDAMLLISLICVTLATLLLVFELRTFGDFPFSYPWRTDEFLNLLLR